MQTLILYQSKNGTTEKYANWLKEDLENCEVSNIETFNFENISQYERIIVASPTYGGQIIIKDTLVKHWDILKSKKVYLLVVGMVPQHTAWSEKAFNLIPKNIRQELAGYIKIPGEKPNKNKKPGWLEKTAMKLFLRVDPEVIQKQPPVRKENLGPVIEVLS